MLKSFIFSPYFSNFLLDVLFMRKEIECDKQIISIKCSWVGYVQCIIRLLIQSFCSISLYVYQHFFFLCTHQNRFYALLLKVLSCPLVFCYSKTSFMVYLMFVFFTSTQGLNYSFLSPI